MTDRLRVHVENDPAAAPALRVDPAVFAAAFADQRALLDRLDVSYNDDPARFHAVAGDAEVLFAARKPEALERLARLKWVQSTSAGVEALLPLVPPNVILTNASGVHAAKGAEFILTSVLMLNYRIPGFVADQAARRWAPVYGGTVAGRTAMLLGVGAIGAAAARALKGVGVRTIGVTRSGEPRPHIDRSATFDDIDALLPGTDFLVSSLPLTPATAGLIDARRLDLLPHHAGVVVVGRARVFDYAALAAKLTAGTLAGAVLDVFPTEPIPDSDALWAVPRLIITPHCSLDDHSCYSAACLEILRENLARYLDGREMINRVDRGLGY